jgi:hypothetical protein
MDVLNPELIYNMMFDFTSEEQLIEKVSKSEEMQ